MTEPLGALRQFLQRPRAAPGEKCEMCATPLSDDHSHVVNVETRQILCSCRPCHLLFTEPGAGRGKYRAVPDRHVYHPSFNLSDAHWDRLQKDAEAQLHVLQQFLGRAPGHAFEEPGNGHATQTSREHRKA